jgi:hypothetical protein
MTTYWFDSEVAGPVTEKHAVTLVDWLTARGGIDATVQADYGCGAVMVVVEHEGVLAAITSALIVKASWAGCGLTRLFEG